ncbi:DASS family sodium-coupled anion symporter [Brackiella oedipodis]|uniref:DASS family sodium-coupled anion symporter n=1 Tax=Brackiella oedipodis TaxID=124225 RepID=UPI00048B1DF3|nr:DASS family sodium-coupled anion symporter [Brackiella oedipodis]
MGFKPIPAAIAVVIGLVIWFAIPIPEGVSPQAWHLLAMFVAVIAAIIGKAMPIGAIGIIAIMLVAITGVTSDKPSQAMNDALSSLSNPLIWLIGVAVMISHGLSKTGLGTRLSYMTIAIWGKTTLGLGYSLAFAELVLAPVTPSNTARGGGTIHPIMKSIANNFESHPNDDSRNKIGKYLALVNYQANPISSAMFITATAPNPLVVNLIADATGSQIHLSWLTWATAMFIPGVIAMALMPLIIYLYQKPEIKKTPNASIMAKQGLQEMGPIKRDEWVMIGVFALMLFLWADIPAMIFGDAYKVNPTATAFLGLSLLLLFGVLTWDDVLKQKSAWDTIIWFGALVMLATLLNKSGILGVATDQLTKSITGMGLGWMSSCLILLLIYLYSHYMFASTTAHITAMFTMFYSAGVFLQAPPYFWALLMAAASSLMMSITHYATGTAPIVYNSGYTTLGEWWKTGFIVSVSNLLIFVFIGGLWWKILGYW